MIYHKSNESGVLLIDSMDYGKKMSKKLLPPSCLFCVNSSTNVNKLKITDDYGGGSTIRYDLTNFLGYQIECYLKDDDFLCSNCMNFFVNMAIIKRKLIQFLQDRDESVDKKMKGFNDIWKMFTKFAGTLVQFNPNDTEETWDLEGINRSQTPNPLVFKYSEPCNDIEMYKNQRCKSAALSEGHVEADREVRKWFKKSGRKRGNNWTRRKGEQKWRALSRSYPYNAYLDSDYDRNCYSADCRSSISRQSSSTNLTPVVRHSSRRKRRKVEGKPLKTRSVSRSEVHKANVMLAIESNKFYCSDLKCGLFFSNVDQLASHKVQDHKIIPRFSCSQCWKAYTNREELEMHNRVHDTYTVHCFQCGSEIRGSKNLQQHLIKHREYSIECRYCNFSFLNKDDLKQHCSREHQEKDEKKVDRKKSTVLKSIVNQKKIKGTCINNNNVTEKEFEPRILLNRTPSPEISLDRVPVIMRSRIQTAAKVSSIISISDASPSEIKSTSPIAISDVSSVIIFREEPMCDVQPTPTPQRLNIVPKDVSCNNSLEVQIVLQEKHVNPNVLTDRIDYIDCDTSFESLSTINRDSTCAAENHQVTNEKNIPSQQASVVISDRLNL